MSLNTWASIEAVVDLQYKYLKQLNHKAQIILLQEVWDSNLHSFPLIKSANHKIYTEKLDARSYNKGIYSTYKELYTEHFRLNIVDIAKRYGVTELDPAFSQEDAGYGLQSFISPDLELLSFESLPITEPGASFNIPEGIDHPRFIQIFKLRNKAKKQFAVINIHGHWAGKLGKVDTPERLRQTQSLVKVINKLDLPVIIAGDFNMSSDTESLKALEASHGGLVNLNRQFDCLATRTSLYTKDIREADYILVSPEFAVKDLQLNSELISDHCALELDFSI